MANQIFKVTTSLVTPGETPEYDKHGNQVPKETSLHFYLETGDEYNAAAQVIEYLANEHGDKRLKGLAIGRLESTVIL